MERKERMKLIKHINYYRNLFIITKYMKQIDFQIVVLRKIMSLLFPYATKEDKILYDYIDIDFSNKCRRRKMRMLSKRNIDKIMSERILIQKKKKRLFRKWKKERHNNIKYLRGLKYNYF